MYRVHLWGRRSSEGHFQDLQALARVPVVGILHSCLDISPKLRRACAPSMQQSGFISSSDCCARGLARSQTSGRGAPPNRSETASHQMRSHRFSKRWLFSMAMATSMTCETSSSSREWLVSKGVLALLGRLRRRENHLITASVAYTARNKFT
jgi:hypothetical protein